MSDAARLADKLESHGHLHLFLDSGAEAVVCKGDTEVDVRNGRVVIDSKEGDWEFSVEKVEYADTEPSYLTPAE